MKKAVSDLIDIPEFNFYINPSEISFFVDKPKNQIIISNYLQTELSKNYENMISGQSEGFEEIIKRRNKLEDEKNKIATRNEEIIEELKKIDGNQLGRKYELIEEQYRLAEKIKKVSEAARAFALQSNNRDSYITYTNSEIIKDVLKKNAKLINSDKLVLYYGMLARKYLNWIILAENEKHNGTNEFCFGNGEIVTIIGNQIVAQLHDSVNDLKSKLADAVLIANREIQSNVKNKNNIFSIVGVYSERGQSQMQTREIISTKELADFAKSDKIISSLDFENIEEYIEKGLIRKWDIVKSINKGQISKDKAIILFEKGILTQEELAKKVFNVAEFIQLVQSNELSLESKLILYSMGKLRIRELEVAVKDNITKDEDISEDSFNLILKYYKKNINKISELLTHDVLDFTQSMKFLNLLEKSLFVSSEEKEYLIDIMNDFKTKQILNQTENGKNEKEAKSENVLPQTNAKGVTIDPKIRRAYLKSIGDVKDVFIKGESFIRDDSDMSKKGSFKRNSLDGYQVIIIPDKKVAVLEKFYEVTRNKEGNVEYKKDEQGNLIPAVENATYIIPIGMAKDFCEKKNKQDLIKSPYVRRVSHTMNWVKNIETKIKQLNPKSEFKKENIDIWNQKVINNYQELLENR